MKPLHPKPAFEPNAYYERVLSLRATDQRAFDSLAPVTKQALYAYETAKREHTRLEAIRAGGGITTQERNDAIK